MTKKICKRCDKEIRKNDKGTTWITFEGEKELEVIHWHFNCFLEWRDENLQNRAKQLYADSMKAIMPQASQMINRILNNGKEETNTSKIFKLGVG